MKVRLRRTVSGLRVATIAGTMCLLVASTSLAQSFSFAVKRDHVIGASEGRLVIDGAGIAYETDETNDQRRWAYSDVKQVQVLSPTRITIETFEDQGWLKLGADRAFEFEIVDAEVTPDLVAFLWDRRPTVSVVSAVDAPSIDEPVWRVAVKRRARLTGSHGALVVRPDRLAFVTDRPDHARVWRAVDLVRVYQPDRHRLNVEAYEGGGDRRRMFSFDLKEPLPPGFLATLWRWVHEPGDEGALPNLERMDGVIK